MREGSGSGRVEGGNSRFTRKEIHNFLAISSRESRRRSKLDRVRGRHIKEYLSLLLLRLYTKISLRDVEKANWSQKNRLNYAYLDRYRLERYFCENIFLPLQYFNQVAENGYVRVCIDCGIKNRIDNTTTSLLEDPRLTTSPGVP